MRSSAVSWPLVNVVRLRRGFFAVVGVDMWAADGTTAAVTVDVVDVAAAVARTDAGDMTTVRADADMAGIIWW